MNPAFLGTSQDPTRLLPLADPVGGEDTERLRAREASLCRALLIVGAGPTGLTLAIELARRGVPFRLIEAAPRPFAGSRGKGLQPRTLEVFDDLGVIDAVLGAGALYPKFRIHAGPVSWRAGTLGSSKAPTADVPYPNIWMVPQSRTEEILRERLQGLGGGGGVRRRAGLLHPGRRRCAGDAVQRGDLERRLSGGL